MQESEVTRTIEHELVSELREEIEPIEEEQQKESSHCEEQQQKEDEFDLDKAEMEWLQKAMMSLHNVEFLHWMNVLGYRFAGAFIVFILKANGEENQVSNEVRASWSSLWQEVDSEFEKDLSGNSDWEFMRNKMFLVTCTFFVDCLDTHLKKFYDASKTTFKKLHILQDSDWWTHFLPYAKKTVLSRMVAICGPMERSPAFMEAVLALLCPEDGLVFEMDCGTLPVMKACEAIECACFSFGNDANIVNLVTRPLVQAITCNKRVCLKREAEHEDDEVNPISNPYD
ncbi:hypothetical protein L7F22_026551 [Adiantum nelumboides]|nr:hypothetical protein [Adiantum nelumboides]